MKTKHLLLPLAGAVLLCGCNRQTKINSAKIDVLTQKVVQLEQTQAKQLSALQTQLAALEPMLDKMNDFYFEKNHDEAFFFHTNTLYLVLTVGNKIEAQLQLADNQRQELKSLAYQYHTNQMDTLYLCATQIVATLADQQKKSEDNINAETRRVSGSLSDLLLRQIEASAPDAAETARRAALSADVAQMKLDLAAIKARFRITNAPAAGP